MPETTTIPTAAHTLLFTHVVYAGATQQMPRVEMISSRDEAAARRKVPEGAQYFYFYTAVVVEVPGETGKICLRADVSPFYFV